MAIQYNPKPLPPVQTIPFSVNSWQGLNRIKGSESQGEMVSTRNMSSDSIPFSSPRPSRETMLSDLVNPQKIFDDENKIGYIADGKFYYDGVLKGECGDTSSVVVYDKRIFTYPSNKYYDIESDTFSAPTTGLVVANGGDNVKISYITSVSGYYSAATYNLAERLNVSSIKTTLTFTTDTIVTNGATFDFAVGNSVIISGCVINLTNNKTASITAISTDKKTLTFAAGTFTAGVEASAISITFGSMVYYTGTPNLTILTSGINPTEIWISAYDSAGTDITVKSSVSIAARYTSNYLLPENTSTIMLYFLYYSEWYGVYRPSATDVALKNSDLAKLTASTPTARIWISNTKYPEIGSAPIIDYATQHNNRIFAVEGNNIYSSAQGKFADWTTFADVDGNPEPTGAFATDVGSVGRFNGIVAYKNRIVCTKPDFVYEIYGDRPPYTVQEIAKTGCIDERSICEVNSVLYWLGRQGIYAYTGGQPRIISDKLNIDFTEGVAGTDGRKYYCSLYSDKWQLYVYDTFTNLWHIEDDLHIMDFTYFEGKLYALTSDGSILKFDSGTERVEWEFETQDYTFDTPNTKSVRRLFIRAELEPYTELDVYLRANNEEYLRVANYQARDMTLFDFKVRVKKCDSFSLKFAGRGNVKILDIHGEVTVGTAKHRSGDNLKVYR